MSFSSRKDKRIYQGFREKSYLTFMWFECNANDATSRSLTLISRDDRNFVTNVI